MKDTVYLVFNRRGAQRMTKKRMPVLKGGEVAVQLTVGIDDSNFRSPLATAEMEVPIGAIITNPDVEVEVVEFEEE